MYPQIDIIYFTLFPWDHSYSSVSLSFSREFTKHNRIFYINHPFTYKDFLFRYHSENVNRRKKRLWMGLPTYDEEKILATNFVPVHPPNMIPTNFLPPGKVYDRLKRHNDSVLLKTIEKVIKDYQLKDFIFLNCFNPFYVGALPAGMGQLLNIYQCIDDMKEEPYTVRHAYRLEQEVIAKSDLTFVTSTNLYQLKYPLNPATYILPNAVDWNIFRRTREERFEKPKELQDLETPTIGYTGNIHASRIDYPLLRKIALNHPDKALVMIGPLNSEDYKIHGLDQLPNVVFTGGKDINDLPRYLQHLDCLIIPFLCDKLTESIYPLKINEYLSSGKPVVSTNFSVDIASFGDYIYLAKNHESFLQLIDTALNEDQTDLIEQRVEVAKSNTWEARVKQFWEVVEPKL